MPAVAAGRRNTSWDLFYGIQMPVRGGDGISLDIASQLITDLPSKSSSIHAILVPHFPAFFKVRSRKVLTGGPAMEGKIYSFVYITMRGKIGTTGKNETRNCP